MRKKERIFVMGIAVVIILAAMLGFIICNISGRNIEVDEKTGLPFLTDPTYYVRMYDSNGESSVVEVSDLEEAGNFHGHLTIHRVSREGVNTEFDEEIMDVLNALKCFDYVIDLEDMLNNPYGAYSVVESSDLELIQSWNVEGTMIELWAGKGNGYLGLIRIDDKVYCAQYINDFTVPDLDTMDTIPEGAVVHQAETYGYGVYYGGRSAYFIDGRYIELIYYYPGFEETSDIARGEEYCVLYWTEEEHLEFVR